MIVNAGIINRMDQTKAVPHLVNDAERLHFCIFGCLGQGYEADGARSHAQSARARLTVDGVDEDQINPRYSPSPNPLASSQFEDFIRRKLAIAAFRRIQKYLRQPNDLNPCLTVNPGNLFLVQPYLGGVRSIVASDSYRLND